MKKFLIVMVLGLLAVPAHAEDAKLIADLQDNSVTIQAGRGEGSGTLFTRQVGDETVTYVWTAAHVVENLKEMRRVIVNGTTKTVTEYADVVVIQEIRQNGRRIGELKRDAKVLKSSNPDTGEDLAVLEIRERNFAPVSRSVQFYLGDEIPGLGTEVYHVGSLLGKFGSNSLTDGIISQIGRVLPLSADGTVFDQVSVIAYPGSSGGGIYLKSNGQYVGMLVRSAGDGFNLVVPVRRLRAWAKSAHILWAVDPTVPMPEPGMKTKMPVEDIGNIGFILGLIPEAKPQAERERINAEFPFLLREDGCFNGPQPTLAPRR